MAKDWNTRLTQTITFVRNTPAPGTYTADRHVVAGALDDWNQTAPAAQRKRLSELMSQEGTTHRPAGKPERALRRATILLQCALIAPDTAGWSRKRDETNNNNGGEANLYGFALETAHDHVCSTDQAGANLAFLLASPKEFLAKYKVLVNGKSTSGRFEYGFTMEKGTYKMQVGNPNQTPTKILAINVPAVLFDTVERSLDSLTGTRSSDYDNCSVMLTTQFTGCTYCFMVSADGSSLVAAHIDPGGGIGRTSNHTGESVSKALRDNGGFRNGNGGVFRAYGRVADATQFGYPTSAQQMIITALRLKNRWRVYAQIAEQTGFTVKRIDKPAG
jgi:hypothetical protein